MNLILRFRFWNGNSMEYSQDHQIWAIPRDDQAGQMLSTGIFDRDGTEIFQNDYVRMCKDGKSYSKMKLVEWRNTSAGIGFNIALPRRNNSGEIGNMSYVVVGNVYQGINESV